MYTPTAQQTTTVSSVDEKTTVEPEVVDITATTNHLVTTTKTKGNFRHKTVTKLDINMIVVDGNKNKMRLF